VGSNTLSHPTTNQLETNLDSLRHQYGPFIDIRKVLYTFCGRNHGLNIVSEGLDVCKMILPPQGINVFLFIPLNSIFAFLLIGAELLKDNTEKK